MRGMALSWYDGNSAGLGHLILGQMYNSSYTMSGAATKTNFFGLEMNIYNYTNSTDNNVIFRLSQDITKAAGAAGALDCQIAGWAFDFNSLHKLTASGKYSGLRSDGAAGTAIRFFAGADDAVGTNSVFKVLENGALTATSATITGAVNATSGKFGTATDHWLVGATGLTAVAASTDVKISYGKTDFGQTATTGFILGYDYSASKPKFEIGSSATAQLLFDGTNLTISGAITATSGAVGGFTIGTDLTYGNKTAYNDNETGIFIGSTGIGLGPRTTGFYVSESGGVIATGVDVSGKITATSGAIGGFTVNSTEGLYAGTGATRVQMKSGAGFWAGADARDSAPFRVTEAGVLTATSGAIAGWVIDSVKILNETFADNVNTRVMLANTSVTPSSVSNLGHAIGLSLWKRYNDSIYYNISIGKGLITTGTDWYTPTAVGDANRVGIQFINYNGSTLTDKVLFEVSQDTTVTNGTTGAGFKAVIAGWKFDHDALYTGTKVTVAGYATNNGDITISRTTGISAKNFYLDLSGNAYFKGDISAASGTFTGNLSIGSGNTIFKADSNGIYLGNATFASAPFSVTMAGALKSTSGTIAGWTVSSDTIQDNTTLLTSKVFLTKNATPEYFDLDTGNLGDRKTPVVSWGPTGTYYFDAASPDGWDLTGGVDIETNWIRYNATGDVAVSPFISVTASTAYLLSFNALFNNTSEELYITISYYNISAALISSEGFTISAFTKLGTTLEKEILTPATTTDIEVTVSCSDWATLIYLKGFSISTYSSLVEISSKGLLVWTGDNTYLKVGGGTFVLKGGLIDVPILYATDMYATSKLTVSGRTTLYSTLFFGSGMDTNLYRSAANTLKTDDALIVTGALTTAGFPLCRYRGEAATWPSSPLPGDVFYDTNYAAVYIYTTTGSWIQIGSV